MLGAIVGDIVGSIYEWHNIKTKDFPLFQEGCFFTDDTVMTCAVAEAVMNGGEWDHFIDAMKKYGRMYPMPDMAVILEHGFFRIVVSRITVLEMARQCVYRPVPGLWIAGSVQEQECGLPTEEKEQSCLPK